MGKMKTYYMDTIEAQPVETEFETYNIFTTKVFKSVGNNNHYWEFYGKNQTGSFIPLKEHDFDNDEAFCGCYACLLERKELSELTALCHALEWFKENYGNNQPVFAWVDWEELVLAKTNTEAFSQAIKKIQSPKSEIYAEKLAKALKG